MKKQSQIIPVDTPPQPQPEPPFQLRSIYLRNSNTQMAQTFDPLQPNQQLHIVSKFEPSASFNTDGSYRFSVDYSVLYFLVTDTTPAPTPETVDETFAAARIAAQFTADYVPTPGATPHSPEDLRQFGDRSALLHTWPYWREYCHATMMRMSLPLVMVPLLTIVHAAPGASNSTAIPPESPKIKARKKPKPT